MPELPEVEIARRQLTRWVAGRRILSVQVLDPTVIRPSLRHKGLWAEGLTQVEGLVGAVTQAPIRHGKRLGWAFEGASIAWCVHFGMTGAWRRGEPPRHARLGLSVDGETVWFEDPRKFGAIVVLPAESLQDRLAEGLGPDALDTPLQGPAFKARMATRSPIKIALMDQARIAGVGNIHAVEALWRAKIAPSRPANGLSAAEYQALAEALQAQLAETVEGEDREGLVYSNLGGPNPFVVYRREGQPCPRCGGEIRREVLGGRATFSCSRCQQR